MPFPFPVPETPVLRDALNIAMRFLEGTGQAYPYSVTQRVCAEVIFNEWLTARRNRIWLANKAIAAIEQARMSGRQARTIPITSWGTTG
jgi:hypothetical protein